jgi:hypothetical protein
LPKSASFVIYPIPAKFVSRIFEDKRTVFVKFVAHPNTKTFSFRKILFYESQGSKEIVGEAVVKTIEVLTPLEVLEKYGKRVFLEENELLAYTKQQPSRTTSRKMQVMVLGRPLRFSKRIKYQEPMTMAGKSLTKEEYEKLTIQQK